jgi:hypothetical protein
MTEDQQIDLDDIQGQLDRIRASADTAEWPEVREPIEDTRGQRRHSLNSKDRPHWPFVTGDEQLAAVAEREGFDVIVPEAAG